MKSDTPILETHIPEATLWRRGKVRDVYDLGDRLLIVATDRISAFDVVLPTGIPGKGAVLTQLSLFWFRLLGDVVPNHVIASDVADYPANLRAHREQLEGRSMLVVKTEPLPVECVVRGYITGSGWKDYKSVGNGLRPSRSRRAFASPTVSRRRSSRPPPRPRWATTRTSRSRPSRRTVGADRARELGT